MAAITANPKTVNNKRATRTLTLGEMPIKPARGQRFNPDTTDAVGVIERVIDVKVKGRPTPHVVYHFEHAPEQSYQRPYSEVFNMAWSVK